MAKKKPANPDQFSLFDFLPPRKATQPALPMDLGPLAPAPPAPPTPPWTPRRSTDGILELSEALRLECNLALMAGAGTGKTYSLITLCLHLLAGARHAGEGPLEPQRLCLVTFTDKAASEMRARLRQRIDALVHGQADQDLSAAWSSLGQSPRPPKFWRKIRDGLGGATIGTFHGLCVQLVKRAPAGSGVNPAFELLDERAAKDLLDDTVERVVLGALERDDAAVVDLCREYDFAGGWTGGLVSWLARAWARIREEGLDPRLVAVGDEPRARAAFESQLVDIRRMLQSARSPKTEDKVRYALQALEGMTVDNAHEKSRLFALEATLETRIRALDEAKLATRAAMALYGAWRVAPYEQTVRQLLVQLEAAYAKALEKKGALDFTGLLVTARDLLRDHPDFRREVQQRFGALLVDEFQDTNRLQLELVMLLSERRAGARAPLSRAFAADLGDEILKLPLEPAFLCAVGDPKQSIYEFRGADVSVFERLANHIVDEGGGRAFLTQSRRASPALVEFFNGAFPKVMPVPPDARPWDVAFTAHDRLTAHRPQSSSGPCVTRLVLPADLVPPNVEAWREADAPAIARYVAWLLRASGTLVHPRSGEPRPIRGGDVALLFRSFPRVELYRQALARQAVAHRVVRGRGFFGAQEVVDLASLLGVVADPSDPLCLAAVLRSPLVGLTDGALLCLGAEKGLLSRQILEQPERDPPLLQEWERQRLSAFRAVWNQLRGERDRLGLRALLKVALEQTGYRTSIAAAPFGEQALANLDKLLELAAHRDAKGMGCASFARELLVLSDTVPLEAQGEVVDDSDAQAVTICTVHQAKGLEWPVVVMPELFTARPPDSDALRFDRDQGLSLRPPETDDGSLKSERHVRLGLERRSRSTAEQRRLFYVATTRARDRLVFGLTDPKHPDFAELALAAVGPPMTLLDPGTAAPSGNPQVEEVDASKLTVPPPPELPAAPPDAEAQVQAIVDRVLHAPRPVPKLGVFPVTQLQDFVLCPRRYRFAHLVGLAERPVAFHWSAEPLESEEPSLDPKMRGIAAHKLIELTPLEDVGSARLRPRLEEIARIEGLLCGPEVLDWVEAFWSTRFGIGLKALGPTRVHRELPFVLRLSDAEGFTLMLRGQIDLLVDAGNGRVQVVDYKSSKQPPEGLAPYSFQLGCYALAAANFLNAQAQVETGISFLREKDPEPLFASPAAGLEVALAGQARALLQAQLDGKWSGLEKDRCQALGCGYVYRCHPGENRL
jgi:ATP-dependent helicase/nuclease subunit A